MDRIIASARSDANMQTSSHEEKIGTVTGGDQQPVFEGISGAADWAEGGRESGGLCGWERICMVVAGV